MEHEGERNVGTVNRITGFIKNMIFVIAAAVVLVSLLCIALQLKPAVVISGSMEPVLHTGSLVIIDMKKKNPEEGDVIAFEVGDSFVTHRLAEKTEDGYITRGDANETNDPWIVAPGDIAGTIILHIPYVGYFIRGISGKTGIILCILVISCVLLAGLLERGERDNENDQEK